MSKSFLSYVAADILSKYGNDLSRTAVVFPNKRASLFLNKELQKQAGHAIWSPAYITISDFFRAHSSLVVADPIKLVCDLYKSFTKVTGEDESLDHFFGWGQMLVADFDDIDKNMADPQKVLANVSDIHSYDDVSYLTDEQKQLLERFFSNFSADQNSRLKENFLKLWSRLLDIYTDFNRQLAEQGLAYEGALYRQVAKQDCIELHYDRYLFVGFNVLQKVEQQLFARIQKQGKAYFYWDFDRYYISSNEAGHYINSYLKAFPNELNNNDNDIYDNLNAQKTIVYAKAPTANIQAKYVAEWLKQGNRIEDAEHTAIVMCDESLLPSIIHSLPEEVENVNITTGYPLSQTPAASFVSALLQLYSHGRADNERWRLHYVNLVLRHSFAKYISPTAAELVARLNKEHIYYPTVDDIATDEGLRLVFETLNDDLTQQLADIISYVARNVNDTDDPLLQESLFSCYTVINRLHELISSDDLVISQPTLEGLIMQLVRSTSIPFHGEPAIGLQVMGVLETRNLDFKHLLLLGCNEGNMPKGVDDSSFIPHAIRKAYDLTTIDYKVAVYAYYFYSMLQRADDITIVYSNSTENGKKGEMSRFMTQLMVESNHKISKIQLQAGQTPLQTQAQSIKKTQEVMARLQELACFFSPTAINSYLRCPLIFYYSVVCKIKEPNDNDDNKIDNRTFGNIFHRSAQLIYQQLMDRNGLVTEQAISNFLSHPQDLERIVDEAFKEELFNIPQNQAFRPQYNGLQLINRSVIIHYLRQLLNIDKNLKSFYIIALEQKVETQLSGIVINGKPCSVTIGGLIDRLDRVNGTIRVIDYKTGANVQKQINSVEAIFDPANIGKHSDYYLQTMLYAMIVSRSKEFNPNGKQVSPALLFIQHAGAEDYDPTLKIGKERIENIETYVEDFKNGLTNLLNEIYDTGKPFEPTSNHNVCQACAYRMLCGRM